MKTEDLPGIRTFRLELSFDGTAWTGGLGTASFAAGMIVGRMVSGVMVSQAKLRNLIVAAAVAGTLLSLLPPVLPLLSPPLPRIPRASVRA